MVVTVGGKRWEFTREEAFYVYGELARLLGAYTQQPYLIRPFPYEKWEITCADQTR